ncbi:histidine kinase [Rhizobium sp. Root1203]|uniref:response regulator n=1 Tax=Rhizobium sp. Root1203 TaxID=1736427 RepID=UPI0007094E6E|nr:response regulator [Rhizobium sp. Root1203]KQV32669.1 histidine kinase [Rhizobium sp. Root1203]
MSDGTSVLIIDDNIDDREVYRRMLARVAGANYTVFEAENGEEGLALNAQTRPDCILLDYSLPGRDGVGVLEEIVKLDAAANVIMLTGQGSETIAVEVMKGGARDYLTKDTLSPETLHRCIQNAIMHGSLETKLEFKRQSLEIFTRAMAHDLKEPLRTIKSFGKLLHGSPALASDDRELLDYVLSAADHMEDLIVKVSGFTKLEASDELELKSMALSPVLDQVERNLREQVGSRRATVLRAALPEVMGDATLLVQLLQNLVSNAIRYCDADSPEVRISAENDGSHCRIVVSDNGPGIDPAYRELVFQPFKRLVGRSVEGTGLGLAICRRIAQLHGGAIWCEEGRSRGATFIVELPLARPAAPSRPYDGLRQERADAERPLRLAEVLLVEDSPADVQILKIKLMKRERVSFNLHVASNGREAMRLLEERAAGGRDPSIDLMLVDINMPIMDGFEVLSALSADGRLNKIPVCILSTSSDEDDMQRAEALGARAYMIKPPTLQQLELALKTVDTLDLQPRGDALILYADPSRHTPSATA